MVDSNSLVFIAIIPFTYCALGTLAGNLLTLSILKIVDIIRKLKDE